MLESVYIGVRSSMQTISVGGCFFIGELDSYSRLARACFMKHWAEVSDRLRCFGIGADVPQTHLPLTLRSSYEGECDNKHLMSFVQRKVLSDVRLLLLRISGKLLRAWYLFFNRRSFAEIVMHKNFFS